MAVFKNRIIATILIIGFSLFSGCSYITHAYIKNYTSKPVEMIIRNSEGKMNLKYLKIFYKNKLLKIGSNTLKKLTDTLPISWIDTSTVSIVIPAKSTVSFRPPSGRMHSYDLSEEIVLKQDNMVDILYSYSGKNNINITKYKELKTFFGFPSTIYYNYKGAK